VVTGLNRQRKENLVMVHLMNLEPGSSPGWDHELLALRRDELDQALEDANAVLAELMLIHSKVEAYRDIEDINEIRTPMNLETNDDWLKAYEDQPAPQLVPPSREEIRWQGDT